MAQSVAPQFPRNAVNRAGRSLRQGRADPDDLRVVENWRASHAHILNAFQTTLRNRATPNIQIVQRLKRLATIEDKLRRRPTFSLTEMQDIAGCRIIFQNIDDLYAFRREFLSSRISHSNLNIDDRYDYIRSPKPDGYRGVHDVFSYSSRKTAGSPWQGLRVEIQYRTNAQHAWATAVEVAGFLTENDPKFGRGLESYIEFFRFASEVIARRQEGMAGPLPRAAHSDLVARINEIDQEHSIINIFENFNRLQDVGQLPGGKDIFILQKSVDQAQERPRIISFDSFSEAVRKLGMIELAQPAESKYDIVLVRNVTGGLISNAYRNYFTDTEEFVRLLHNST